MLAEQKKKHIEEGNTFETEGATSFCKEKQDLNGVSRHSGYQRQNKQGRVVNDVFSVFEQIRSTEKKITILVDFS